MVSGGWVGSMSVHRVLLLCNFSKKIELKRKGSKVQCKNCHCLSQPRSISGLSAAACASAEVAIKVCQAVRLVLLTFTQF